MKPEQDIKQSNDIWLATQLEAIRRIELEKTPDVTEAVMHRINQMPAPTDMYKSLRRRRISIVSGLAAACFAGVILFNLFFINNNLQAANQPKEELSYRFYEFYDYCNEYSDDETLEDAAYLDNPVSLFI